MYFFLSPVRTFLCGTYCDSTWIIAGTSSCENNTQWRFHVSFSTYITYFLFHFYNICYSGTFPRIDVSIMTSLVNFPHFGWIMNSLYHIWLIACSKLFWLLTDKYCHIIRLQDFWWCSFIVQLFWTIRGSLFPNHQ